MDPLPAVPGASVHRSAEVPAATSARGARLVVVKTAGVPPLRPTDASAPWPPEMPPLAQ